MRTFAVAVTVAHSTEAGNSARVDLLVDTVRKAGRC